MSDEKVSNDDLRDAELVFLRSELESAFECMESKNEMIAKLQSENERLQKLIEDAIPLVESSLNWFWTQDEINSWTEEAKKGGEK